MADLGELGSSERRPGGSGGRQLLVGAGGEDGDDGEEDLGLFDFPDRAESPGVLVVFRVDSDAGLVKEPGIY
ncbi:uncharacterized protein A4U43_C09F2880 [Asparagus officinalis]|uniref:Uncharacterized protein n=1 Tax=Asparagus officinalis TaxID=4686 RepID=A0A5P1E4W5_ASPOF|nr:uncharacterized protein A4U43_C09F2880 [Asparagus officinalis]